MTVSSLCRLALFILSAVMWSFLVSPRAVDAGSLFVLQPIAAVPASGQSTALNDAGSAVGFGTNPQGNQTPGLYENGQESALSGIGTANAISNSGLVVGTTFVNGAAWITTWESNGQFTRLAPGYGLSVNDSNDIGGGFVISPGVLHAFIDRNGGFTDLGVLGGSWSAAYGINAADDAAGTSSTANGNFHAFFFSAGQGMVDLGTLGGSSSYGSALNDQGTVVGTSQTASGFEHAFAWQGQTMTDLGTLGGTASYAYGINGEGSIVGSSLTASGAMHGFESTNGVLIDLNSWLPLGSGWVVNQAFSINDQNDILAEASLNGQNYAVELTVGAGNPQAGAAAVPEPATVCFAAVGFLLVGLWKRTSRTRQRVTG